MAGEFRRDERPDKLGVYVTSMQTPFGRVIRFHEVAEGSLRTPRVRAFFDAQKFHREMIVLGLLSEGQTILGGPAELLARYRAAAAGHGVEFLASPFDEAPACS